MDDWQLGATQNGGAILGHMDDTADFPEETEPQTAAQRLRKAQLAALRLAEAQMVAKKRFDAEAAARAQATAANLFEDVHNLDGSEVFDAAVPAYMEPMGIQERYDMVLQERCAPIASPVVAVALEEPVDVCGYTTAQAEWSQSERSASSATWSLTNSEASKMKAKIYEAMAQLARARELARNDLEETRSSSRSSKEASREEVAAPSSPPRTGAAWEAARLLTARALSEGIPPSPPSPDAAVSAGLRDVPAVSTTSAAGEAPLPATGTLGLKRYEVQQQEKFDAMVRQQMKAQEAMKKRVESSAASRGSSVVLV